MLIKNVLQRPFCVLFYKKKKKKNYTVEDAWSFSFTIQKKFRFLISSGVPRGGVFTLWVDKFPRLN